MKQIMTETESGRACFWRAWRVKGVERNVFCSAGPSEHHQVVRNLRGKTHEGRHMTLGAGVSSKSWVLLGRSEMEFPSLFCWACTGLDLGGTHPSDFPWFLAK